MNDDEIQQNLKKQFEALPPEVQRAIKTINLSEKLQEVVKNNKLMIDQAGKLEMETMLVLLGLEPLENYVKNLQENVGLSNIQASVVAHDVNELIFKGIRDELKKINDEIIEADKKSTEGGQNPSREDVLKGIEEPTKIKLNFNEPSISMSSQKSNMQVTPEIHPEMAKEGIEIRVDNLPEIAPKISFPMKSPLSSKPAEPFHTNTSPVKDIVEAKLNTTVAVPKETIIVEDKSKLPEKPKISGSDAYREPII